MEGYLSIDVQFGVAELPHASHKNYAGKLKACLKWAYKVVKETNDCEATRHKIHYDQKFKCMKIVPADLVLVQVKAFGPGHKIADCWEQVMYKVLSQHKDSPVYKYNLLIIAVMRIFIHCTGICCFHFNHFVKMKLKLKSKMWH